MIGILTSYYGSHTIFLRIKRVNISKVLRIALGTEQYWVSVSYCYYHSFTF